MNHYIATIDEFPAACIRSLVPVAYSKSKLIEFIPDLMNNTLQVSDR